MLGDVPGQAKSPNKNVPSRVKKTLPKPLLEVSWDPSQHGLGVSPQRNVLHAAAKLAAGKGDAPVSLVQHCRQVEK
eukprot:450024-Ditylum_brightwellii.AAC.1